MTKRLECALAIWKGVPVLVAFGSRVGNSVSRFDLVFALSLPVHGIETLIFQIPAYEGMTILEIRLPPVNNVPYSVPSPFGGGLGWGRNLCAHNALTLALSQRTVVSTQHR